MQRTQNGTLRNTSQMFFQDEVCPFKTTLCILFAKKSLIRVKSEPLIPYEFSLKRIHLCHTLSRKPPCVTSGGRASKFE